MYCDTFSSDQKMMTSQANQSNSPGTHFELESTRRMINDLDYGIVLGSDTLHKLQNQRDDSGRAGTGDSSIDTDRPERDRTGIFARIRKRVGRFLLPCTQRTRALEEPIENGPEPSAAEYGHRKLTEADEVEQNLEYISSKLAELKGLARGIDEELSK